MKEQEQHFDPARYLSSVSGRAYLEVKWRLVWLRSVYPEATVDTELMEHRGNVAVFRARVTIPAEATNQATGELLAHGASASGWGQEQSTDFGDYLEKAETKALGRALAALGFGTQFCSDFDFGAEQQRVVDSPVGARPASGGGGGGGMRQEPTPRQVTYLTSVARELGLSPDALDERALAAFGQPVAALGKREVSTLIEQLQAERPLVGQR